MLNISTKRSTAGTRSKENRNQTSKPSDAFQEKEKG